MKKTYRVRRTVDQSVRYFEAGYLAKRLLHDRDDDDDEHGRRAAKSSSSAAAAGSFQRQASTRSTQPFDYRRSASVRSSFNYDSVANSDDVDDVTNIKR